MTTTLGEAADQGWALWVQCDRHRAGLKSARPCIGRVALDLHTMVWTHGRQCPLTYLEGRLRCPRCGTLHVLQFWSKPAPADRQAVR